MYKVIKLSKEVVELIDNSVFKGCNVNTVFKIVLNFISGKQSLFLERIFSVQKSVDKVTISAKLEAEEVDRIDRIVNYLKSKKIVVSRSFAMFCLLNYYLNPVNEIVMSLNVKGYKCKDTDLLGRLMELTVHIDRIMPDIIFLQEMRIGEDRRILDPFLSKLGIRYFCMMPASFIPDQEYNACICAVLIRCDMLKNCKILKIGKETKDWKKQI